MNETLNNKLKHLLKMIDYCSNIPSEREKWINTLLSFLDGAVSATEIENNKVDITN